MKGWEKPPDALTMKDRIDVEEPEWKKVVYKFMRAMSESLNGRVESRLAYSRLRWQGLENASIHASLVLMVVYATAIATTIIGRLEMRYNIAYFA